MPSENLDGGGKCSTLASKTGCNAHEKKGRVIMKRLIGILLVVLAVFCFVACDSDNPSPSGSASMPDEKVMTQYSNVMSDADSLLYLMHMSEPPAEYEDLVVKFEWQDRDTVVLKEGETAEGYSSGYLYSSVWIRSNDEGYEVDAEYNDGTSSHSIYLKNTLSADGVPQISIEFDGVNYYIDASTLPGGYPSN